MLLSLAVLLLALLAAGRLRLSPSGDDIRQSSELQLRMGTQILPTHVIGIASNGGQGFGICTGTLISPNVVLTAALCFADAQ